MHRKLIDVWMFLAVLSLVLLSESSTTGDGVFSPSHPRGNDKESLDDDSGEVPRGPVDQIPKNQKEFYEQTKNIKCDPGKKVMYVLHPQKIGTYVGCYRDKLIHGYYCPEFNGKGVQPKYGASCNITNTVPICNITYLASSGYKFHKCFEIYGGISSTKERETFTTNKLATTPTTLLLEEPNERIKSTRKRQLTTPLLEKPVVIGLISLVLFLILIIIFLICYIICKRKYWFKKRPNTNRTCMTQIARGEIVVDSGSNIHNE